MIKKMFSCAAVMLIACATVFAGDVDLEGVQCVVRDKAASEDKSAEYKDGKVYFCCNGCAGKFAKTPKKFAAKANQQLVATKQYEQKACPISGNDVDPATEVTVAGTKVSFCCGKCKAKVEGAKNDVAKMRIVFSDKAFEKGFAKADSGE